LNRSQKAVGGGFGWTKKPHLLEEIMSKQNSVNEAEKASMSEATTTEMTREEYYRKEHAVQTGASETLPDGRNIKDVREGLNSLQAQQENDLRKRSQKWLDKSNKNAGIKTDADFLKEKIEVSGFENGAVSARPFSVETLAAPPTQSNVANEPLSDLPADFPGRKHLIAGKVYSLEAVAKLDRDGLIAIDGIAETTADKILAYGKTE
jgi:hypothetical protein